MASECLQLALVFLFLSAISWIQADSNLPRNSAGRDNEPLELECTYENEQGDAREVQWRYFRIGSTSSSVIYMYGSVISPYIDEYSKGSVPDNIIAQSMNYNRAGRYACSTVDIGPALTREIQVATASPLQCEGSSNETLEVGDNVLLLCYADVSANYELQPQLQWYRNGMPVQGIFLPPTVTPTPNSPERHMLAYNFTVGYEDGGVPFECELSYKYVGDPDSNDDPSDPSFVDSCSVILSVNGSDPWLNETGPGLNETGPGLNETGPGLNETGPGLNVTGSIEIFYERRNSNFEVSGKNDTLAALPIFQEILENTEQMKKGVKSLHKEQMKQGDVYRFDNGEYRVVAGLDDFAKIRATFSGLEAPDIDLLRLKHEEIFLDQGWTSASSFVDQNVVYIKWEKN